jgi:hypothetical protein
MQASGVATQVDLDPRSLLLCHPVCNSVNWTAGLPGLCIGAHQQGEHLRTQEEDIAV